MNYQQQNNCPDHIIVIMPPYFGHQDGDTLKRSAARAAASLTSSRKPSVPLFEPAIHCNLSSNVGSSPSVYPIPIVWKNVLLFIILHSSLLYSLYAILTDWPFATIMFATAVGMTSGLGVTVGAHRLWSHRSYKAKLPLRIFLMIMQTTAGQNSLYEWCRDHRVHHKFSETDADPHNAKRGFFFSHMGWLMVKKHPDVLIRGASVPMSDLLEDPVVRFQQKYGPSSLSQLHAASLRMCVLTECVCLSACLRDWYRCVPSNTRTQLVQ